MGLTSVRGTSVKGEPLAQHEPMPAKVALSNEGTASGGRVCAHARTFQLPFAVVRPLLARSGAPRARGPSALEAALSMAHWWLTIPLRWSGYFDSRSLAH